MSSGEATKMADKYFITKTGTKRMCQTTQGWKFLVKWTNGMCQWIDLKILKESNPVQVMEYVTAHDIAEEPAFACWRTCN
jgi:predicted transcriptional regulator